MRRALTLMAMVALLAIPASAVQPNASTPWRVIVGGDSGTTNPVYVNDSAQGSGTSGAVQVLTTATAVPTTGLAGRRSLALRNDGPNDIFCGFSASVTTATGFTIDSGGGFLSMDIAAGFTVYCIAATAAQVSPADTRYIETS